MQQPYSHPGMASFHDSTSMPAYASGQPHYYNAPEFALDARKDHNRSYQRRNTPSGSASPSLPQSLEHPPSAISSTSGASGQSQETWGDLNQGLGIAPDVIHNDGFPQDSFPSASLENELCFQGGKFPDSFVGEFGKFSSLSSFRYLPSTQDLHAPKHVSPSPCSVALQASRVGIAPSVMPIDSSPSVLQFPCLPIQAGLNERPRDLSSSTDTVSPSKELFRQPAKPASANFPVPDQLAHVQQHATSPTQDHYHQAQNFISSCSNGNFGSEARRLSIASSLSRVSQENTRSASLSLDEDGKERGRCPNPDCGRLFKDLKAHMLTHQSERPEKCPIMTCEYHQKGFARKYDKNRHTLTHYKGTMVCGFCPGSGSAAEKSFNRADVFKRHLTSLHGVEQTPPNSRKKSPTASAAKKTSDFSGDAAGKCSTCSAMFSNAQEFYEHLDDCVLRVVQQEEPSEAINEQHLTEVAHDRSVLETLDRNMIHGVNQKPFNADEDDEGSEGVHSHAGGGNAIRKPGRGGAGVKIQGMTLSKGGVPLVGKGRKKRKHYPVLWGCSADKMKMKKRVLCVYDGPRRLWKDDMMLDSEFEVRMRLGDGGAYVTDLDVNTLKRADALHNATEEEKGPWMPEEDAADIQQLMSQ
ncbi:MAG: hypothetical protein Q9215_005741 [Flavoplaca cf. flavocitrina]